jgi:hypothetical protein
VNFNTPEEIELEKKLDELVSIESELAEGELDLITLLSELQILEKRYLSIVGARYAELDEIEAQIAEILAARNLQDNSARESAANARTRAEESARTAGDFQELPEREKFEPSENLRKLYRMVAKRIHPDLTTDDEERARRTQLMAEVNRAYEEGNEARLEAILREWESSPEAVEGDSTGARLVRTIRKIAQVKDRLQAIQIEIQNLKETDLFELKSKFEAATIDGRDLFNEMAARIDEKIQMRNSHLHDLRGQNQ